MAEDSPLVELDGIESSGGKSYEKGKGKEKSDKSYEKRGIKRRLAPYDLMPSQMHNSEAESGIVSVNLEKVWETLNKGNDGCVYHLEVCDRDKGKQGYGVLRCLKSIKDGGDFLLKSTTHEVFNGSKQLKAAIADYNSVKGDVEALCMASSRYASLDSAASVAYASRQNRMPATDVSQHAKKVWAWMNLPKSAFRSMMIFLGQGGTLFNVQVYDKSLRAFVAHGGIDEEGFISVLQARLCPTDGYDESDGLDGIRDLR